MRLLSGLDFLLLPLFLVVLSLLFKLINKRLNPDKEMAVHFRMGFRLKIFFCIAFAFFSALVSPGDTEMYYTGGIDFRKIVIENPNNWHFILSPASEFGDFYEANGYRPENYGFINAPANLMAMKIVALFSVFSFNSYLVISIFFGCFSFFGLWFMFKVFCKIYPAYHKALFIPFFCIPAVLFWGGGILRDTLCIGFLGIGFYNAYLFLLEKKYKLKTFIAFTFCFYCLYILKPYIAMAFILSFIFWYIIRSFALQQSKMAKAALIVVPFVLISLYLGFSDLNKVIVENAAETFAETMTSTQESYIRMTPDDGALIDYGVITPTVGGILKICPKALVATLFRPFIWEAKKATSLFAALEGTVLFLFTIFVFFKKGFFKTFYIIFSDSTILFCFVFSIIFATAIGLNCFNLGTLVRYKIPCLPFFALCFLLVLKKGSPVTQETVSAV